MRTLSYYLALVLLLGGVASCQRETDPAPEEDVDLYTLSLSRGIQHLRTNFNRRGLGLAAG